ncbi:hypothetical protein Bca101_052470 [Brassica carinata]
MEGTLERHSLLQFGQLSKLSFDNRPPSNAAEDSSSELRNELGSFGTDAEKEFILSQDFFCTPDYITPDNQNLMSELDINMDHSPCPSSPVKLTSAKTKTKTKRCRHADSFSLTTSDSTWPSKHKVDEQENDDIDPDEIMVDKTTRTGYVSRTALALRSRVMPPPCLKNPYLNVMNESETATDPFAYQRSKCASEFISTPTLLVKNFMRGPSGIIEIAKALQFVHERGIAHLDVKPENIYIKNGVCKLGDFGCATRLDKSLPVEEGDARYMPQEILNENYEHLDKVDIFSLGVTVYELIRGSPLTESRNKSMNIKEGKLPLLPGHSLQLQQLLKTMMDREPSRRPSARELMEHPMFDMVRD